MKITPYELRVAPADRRHGTLRYGDAEAVVTVATTTSGSGVPVWMRRAAHRIEEAAVTTIEEARVLVAEMYARRYRDRLRPLPARGSDIRTDRLIAPPGWLGDTPCTPEETLRQAGIDDARQAAYQRRLSALLAGRGAEA